ncbi:MAG: Acyl-CoA dehydrogenase, long-chain specific, partial [uncultured Nocardioidaceae bacterium]
AGPVRQRGAEGPLPGQDGEPGHLVVPGLLRARRRLRPGRPAHHRRPGRRRVGRQRSEDLDDHGSARRLDLLPGPHGPDGGEEAARHLDAGLPDGHPRRDPAPDR